MILQLQEYTFEILSRSGPQNGNADALSRPPVTQTIASAPLTNALIAVVTRAKTNSLPPSRRIGADPDLLLDPAAYDLEAAVVASQTVSTAQSASERKGEESMTSARENDIDDCKESDSDTNGESKADAAADEDAEGDATAQLDTASPLDYSALRDAQSADPDLSPILSLLRSSTPPDRPNAALQAELSNYALHDDVLFRVRQPEEATTQRLGSSAARAVIPKSWRAKLLLEYHDGSVAGHLGMDKTYGRLVDKYWWAGMYADVKAYIQSCLACAAKKSSHHHRDIPLGSLPVATKPFDALGIDVLCDLPKTSSGNIHILVITDYHTRWPMAFPMANQSARTIAKIVVEEVFLQHGYPTTLLSDRGSNFLSDLLAAVLLIFKVKKLNTTSYHPQTNGLTERFNHTLCTMLTHYIDKQQSDWDTYLPYVLFAYRTAPQATTRQSPFYTLYGRNPRFPFDSLVPDPAATHLISDDETAETLEQIVNRIRVAQEAVTARMQGIADQRAANNAELNAVQTYHVGDQVMIYRPAVDTGTAKKLTALWQGPYEIVEVSNNRVNYKVTRLTKKGRKHLNGKVKMVHVQLMKPFYAPESSSIRIPSAS
jgi:hypothetical protein